MIFVTWNGKKLGRKHVNFLDVNTETAVLDLVR